MNTVRRNVLIGSLGIVTAVFLAAISGHVDFHPDESIYYDAIAVSLRNDSGAFYNLFYGLLQEVQMGPQGARLVSALLGGATFIFLMQALAVYRPTSVRHTLLAFLAFACSYQAIFVFVRVRPEAAWWGCGALALYILARMGRDGLTRMWPLLPLLALLPMNHRLSWFACAFIVGYALLFLRGKPDRSSLLITGLTLVVGAILNVVLRAWWLGVPLMPALIASLHSPSSPRQPFREFITLVFKGAPLFLSDTAQNANLYSWLWPSRLGWLSHEFVQNSFWGLMFILPAYGRSWKERYCLAFPLFAFFAFWLSGYYNPTYAAGFSLFCVLAIVVLGWDAAGWKRALAIVITVANIVNGASFIVTRVLNHGPATFFASERMIRDVAEKLPAGARIALPERYTPAVSGLPLQSIVDFKADIPVDVDVLVVDSYDTLMYGFVPDFERQKQSLASQAARMCLQKQVETPVYEQDTPFSVDPAVNRTRAGSWFFRNSASYVISIYSKCASRHEPNS